MAVAPSPYVKQYNRRRSTRGQAAAETSSGQVVQQQGSDQSSGVATVSNQTMTQKQQHALASSVSQLLVPEISRQISQAIATIERSPSNVATPIVSNTGMVNEQSHVLFVHNDNDQNLSSVSITSIMDNIGIHVSQQLKEKIVKREYVDLENLLPVTLSESNNVGSRNIVMDQFGMLKLQTKTNKI